jgi:hypothetical protein
MQASTKQVQESGVWDVLPSSSSQIRYGSVSWSFDTPNYCVKPPHYHGSLLRTSRPRRRYRVIWDAKPFGPSQHPTTLPHDSAEEWPHSDLLNHQFIAVKVAEEVVGPYEVDVGFIHSIMPDIILDKSYFRRVRSSVDVNEEVQFGRSQWAAIVRDFIGDIHLSRAISSLDLDGASIVTSTLACHPHVFFAVSCPQSSLSSLEYDSEPSTDSDLPRTPTQRSTSFDVEVRQHSPVLNARGLSVPKALSGSARAFTPKSGPSSKHSHPLISPSSASRSSPRTSSSSTPVNFTFPAINGNYQYLPQGLKKDEQGFYSSITPPSSPSRARLDSRLSSTRLPHFLSDTQSRSRKASRTRVIVDQMKAIPVTSKKGRPHNHSKSPSREADSPLSPESSSPSDVGETKNPSSLKGEDGGKDSDATFNFSPSTTDTLTTAGNHGWKELSPVPTPNVKVPFPDTTTPGCASFAANVPFLIPSFYPVPHTPAYPYPYVPPPTSWVPITIPAYPSGVYTRPVVAHATHSLCG